jgi:CRP/FNR family cyclic AMP-dependent transcriptional regulator
LLVGERNDRSHFILEGKVEVTRRGVKLVDLGEGETFGEMELLDVMPAAASIRVIEPLAVATITNRAIHEIFRMDTRTFALIIMNLARDLSRRLRRMDGIVSGA